MDVNYEKQRRRGQGNFLDVGLLSIPKERP